MTFEIKENNFYKDSQPIKLISGAVHYFRNMPDTWPDIFAKLAALGCNCVETYCAWNLHEPRPGEFDFSGRLDIEAFLCEAEKAGLMAIVRPGPYICAEWEFGGLPWWIQTDDDIEIRCMNKAYIEHFDKYLDVLLAKVRPHLATNGGNVIMLQCENEYGYYGDDKKYLAYLRDGYRTRGIDVPLFTSDGTSFTDLADGTVRPSTSAAALRKISPHTINCFRTSPKCAWKCGTAGSTPGAMKSTIPPTQALMPAWCAICSPRAA